MPWFACTTEAAASITCGTLMTTRSVGCLTEHLHVLYTCCTAWLPVWHIWVQIFCVTAAINTCDHTPAALPHLPSANMLGLAVISMCHSFKSQVFAGVDSYSALYLCDLEACTKACGDTVSTLQCFAFLHQPQKSSESPCCKRLVLTMLQLHD